MKHLKSLLLLVAVGASVWHVLADESEEAGSPLPTVNIGVKFRPDSCDPKTKVGDWVGVHYVGKLENGEEFDNSITRGEPIEFQLGAQQVIAGWETGILGMCVGEKRRLHIPPHLAYGDEGAGPIPAGASLVFDVELVRITDTPQSPPEEYEEYQQYNPPGTLGLYDEDHEEEDTDDMMWT
ncbi:hypothetical protein CHLRE_11g478750v5 [Chlamydomonas reinhardtii]|uniref:peptidylprolyl isomerase n=1 Tax=Chlamydomonas reinhardtii TaxID=3055 RepID=A8J741_CHLRE|nr:uncharacterized protein CHLRE_11g478750v5 [Chlamydomonas reinhardtii]PNW76848.1 hypothetical protein CHLRE_11g478750v5 [Chlamydomonas reinhardtii]|eukprot:XP_001697374.1 peptidyl-prolyl cis-trans isomerase, FKBP-type [Chlamydomonas reinhardtii]